MGPATYTPGQEVSFQLPGILRIRDVERPFTWDVEASLEGDTITGTASSVFTFDQFDMQKPQLARILSIRDDVKLEATIVARRAPGPTGS